VLGSMEVLASIQDQQLSVAHPVDIYVDDELGLDYIMKHFDTPCSGSDTWRMLIVDGHCSHTAYPVVEYGLDHGVVIY